MGKGTNKTPWSSSQAADPFSRIKGRKGTRPTSAKKPTAKKPTAKKPTAKKPTASKAQAAEYNRASAEAKKLRAQMDSRNTQDKTDVNRNYEASVVAGNAENTKNINDFNDFALGQTDKFNLESRNLTNQNLGQSQQNTSRHQQELGQNLGRQDRDSSQQTSMYNQGLQNSFNDYSSRNNSLTSQLGKDVNTRGSQYAADKNNAYSGYNDRSRALLDKMGTADQDIHTRNRGQAYAGLDSGFGDASDDLQASLARRGMAGSGVGAKSMGDLSQARMRAGAEAGVNAYNSAIDMSDNRRGQRIQGEQNLYGAETGNLDSVYGSDMTNMNSLYGANMGSNESNYGARNSTLGGVFNNNMNQINSRFTNANNLSGTNYNLNQASNNDAYQKNMGQLGQAYGNTMGAQGQAMQNRLNNTQQRLGNNLNRMQLGRGMAGMSQNYLQQAGSGFSNIAGMAGQSAVGLGGLNNSYNATMQQAQSAANNRSSEAKGGMLGTAGKLGTAALFSDARLKENLVKVGEFEGLNIYNWDWNEDGIIIAGDTPTTGFVAQEVQELYPEYVAPDPETGYLQVKYGEILRGVSLESLIGKGE